MTKNQTSNMWSKCFVVLSFMTNLVFSSMCSCGRGGVCRVSISTDGVSLPADPCSCEFVSKGIFVTGKNNCNKLEVYCKNGTEPCLNGGTCSNAFGNYVCKCRKGWIGSNCETPDDGKPHSSFVHIWYRMRQEAWQHNLYISVAGAVPSTSRLILNFTDGRIDEYLVSSLPEIKFAAVLDECTQDSNHRLVDEDCVRLTQLRRGITKEFYFKLSFTFPYTVTDRVVNDRVEGALGQYNDVHISFKDEHITYLSNSYRIFNDFGDQVRTCPFSVEHTGCSASLATAPLYKMGSPITLEVSTTFTDNLRFPLRKKCIAKFKMYDWFIFPLRRVHWKFFDKLGTGETLTLNPLDVQVYPGPTAIKVDTSFHDIPEISDISVSLYCFINLVVRELKVTVLGLEKEYECGQVEVKLTCKLLYPDYPMEQLRYNWSCPTTVCGNVLRNTSVLKFSAEPECNTNYSIELTVSHHWSPQVSFYHGILKVSTRKTNILLTCEPHCGNLNRRNPVTVVATEVPPRSQTFQWISIGRNKVDLSTVRDVRSSTNVLLIKPNSFQAGSVYTFQVKTRYASETFRVVVNSPPENGTCRIDPESGDPLNTVFKVSCEGWQDANLPLTYSVHEGPQLDLVAISTLTVLEELHIVQSSITIRVTDSDGLFVDVKKKVNIEEPTEDDWQKKLQSIPQELDELQTLYHERNQLGMIRVISRISKLRKGQEEVPYQFKQKLMHHLARIRPCMWWECVHKVANSLKRLCHRSLPNGTKGADEFILGGGTVLQRLSLSFDHIFMQSPSLGAYHMLSLFQATIDAFSKMIRFVDPLLNSLTLDEDIRRIHFRKIQEGNALARQSLRTLGLFASGAIPYPAHPLVVSSENSEDHVVIISNNPQFINTCLRENATASYIQFSEESIPEYKTPTSLTFVSYGMREFWWNEHQANSSDMIEVFIYQREINKWNWTELDNAPGPINIHLKINQIYSWQATGEIRHPDERNYTERQLEAFPKVYLFIVPRGHGTITLTFPDELVGKLKALATLDRPNYVDFNSTELIKWSEIVHNYYTKEELGNVYLSLIPRPERLSYTFNFSLRRCVTRTEDLWISETCKYNQTLKSSEPKYVICTCSHLSLFSTEILYPPNKLVLTQDIYLFTEIVDNWYISMVLCAVFIVVSLLLVYSFIQDRKDETKKTVILLDDNYPGNRYPYLVAVYTGERCQAGTSANVSFTLIGEKFRSQSHILTSKSRRTLQQAMDDWFMVYTRRYLGPIHQIELWHDSKGHNPDWYCAIIIVYDMTAEVEHVFQVGMWLTTEVLAQRGDTSFIFSTRKEGHDPPWTSYIGDQLTTQVRENHHWASICIRHPRSLFTRCERVVIATVMILVSILTSMMFFTGPQSSPVDYPVVSYTKSELKETIYVMIVAFVITIPTAYLFERGKEQIMRELSITVADKLSERESEGKKWNLREWVQGLYIQPIPYMPVMSAEMYAEKTRYFNRWTLVAWIASVVTIVICVFFISLYGLKFGKRRSLVWLITFLLALFGDSLLSDPIKLVVNAFFVSYIFRKAPKGLFFIEIEYDNQVAPYRDYKKRLAFALSKRVEAKYKPPFLYDVREMAKAKRQYYVKTVNVINIVSIAFLGTAVIILILYLDIERNYYKIRQLEEHFTRNRKSPYLDLDSVRNRTGYFDYLRATVLPSLHRLTWYNGQPLHTEFNEPRNVLNTTGASKVIRGFVTDYSTKLIGVPQLRQKRISTEWKSRVPQSFIKVFPEAHGHLTPLSEDRKWYLPKWIPPSNKSEILYQVYDYEGETLTRTGPYLGVTGLWYSGGGYWEKLDWTLGNSQWKLLDLELEGWLDNMTRAVIFNFNLYTLFVDRISSVTVITECLPSGIYVSRTKIDAASLTFSQSPEEQVVFIVAISITVILIFHVSRTTVLIARDGFFVYVSTWSGLNDVAVILAGVAIVTSFGNRFFYFYMAEEELETAARDVYTPLYRPFFLDMITYIITGIFSISITSLLAVLIHIYFKFETVKTALVCARDTIIFFFFINLSIAFYISALIYSFGAMRFPNFYVVYTFKVTRSRSELIGPDTQGMFLLFVAFILVFFLRFSAAAFVIFYEKAEVMEGRRSRVLIETRGRAVLEVPLEVQEGTPSTSRESNQFRSI